MLRAHLEQLADVSVYSAKIYIGQHYLLEVFILLREIKSNRSAPLNDLASTVSRCGEVCSLELLSALVYAQN